MNHDKIHSLLIEYNDDLALLQWFMDRGDDRACRDIIRYLHILGDDIDRAVDDSMPSSAYHKSSSTERAGAGSEPVPSRHLGGLTLVLEREYRK